MRAHAPRPSAVGTSLAASAALAAAVLAAAPASAQQEADTTETYRLRGASVAVHDVAGRVELVPAQGEDVRVEVTRRGADAERLSVATGVVDGRQTLRVLLPEGEDRVVYPEREGGDDVPGFLRWLGVDDRTEVRVRPDGRIGESGRRVRVTSSGDGLRAWADLRVLVPQGQEVAVHLGAGRASVRGVEGAASLDVHSGAVDADGVRGPLSVETGSGSVRAASIAGDLEIDTGSGSVRLEGIDGSRVAVRTGSGGVEGAGLRTESLSVDTGSGSVDLREVAARLFTVDTGSGSVTLGLLSDLDRGSVDTGSGSVELTVPSDFGARLDLDTGSGGIDVELPASDVRTDGGWTGTVGDGRGTLEVDTGSGSVTVRRG